MISINLPSLQSAALQYYAQFIPPFQNFDKNRASTVALREINHAGARLRQRGGCLRARSIDIAVKENGSESSPKLRPFTGVLPHRNQ
jgi:hypothetical protein